MVLTTEYKQILKSTMPIFKENGKEITSILYKHMFAEHPELLNMFNRTNQKTGTQQLALANTIYLAIENIDNLDVISEQILLIAHKHRAVALQPEHYPIVGKCLLTAIDEFFGGMADPDTLNAWSAAYNFISSKFIDIETKLYEQLGDKDDQGFIPFTIVRKKTIAYGPVVSFAFERRDRKQLLSYHAGQYISVRLKINGNYHIRHYSLTQPYDGNAYQIAIKQENETEPKGIVSTELIEKYKEGDIVKISLPAGNFHLREDAKHHLFIAGRIGITVLSSMILELHKQGKENSATLIHCVRTENHAAFSNQMRSILPENQYHLLIQNRQLLQGLIRDTLKTDTHVYICGSVPFMNKVEDCLTEFQHPSSHIHIEAFRPSLSIIKNAVKDQSKTKTI